MILLGMDIDNQEAQDVFENPEADNITVIPYSSIEAADSGGSSLENKEVVYDNL